MPANENDPVQYSLRMNRALYDEVRTLSKLSKSTMSKFILTAIRSHATRRRKELQRTLTEDLRILQEYAKRDPEYHEAIEKIADAEVNEGANPIEEEFYDVRDEGKQRAVDSHSLEEFLEDA